MKKITITITTLLIALILFVGCEQIKQAISDTAAPQIEKKVNEMLGLNESDKEFKLPDAKRYEGFSVETTEEKDTYKIDVIEPKVSFVDYAEELNNTLDAKFTREMIEEGIKQETWTFNDGNEEYVLYFHEVLDENGNVSKWQIQVEVKHN